MSVGVTAVEIRARDRVVIRIDPVDASPGQIEIEANGEFHARYGCALSTYGGQLTRTLVHLVDLSVVGVGEQQEVVLNKL